jgi:hypothetical protein
MSINKYQPHVWIIPEDRANEEIANGFIQHHAVDRAVATRAVQVVRPAGGWSNVIVVFEREYVPWLRRFADSQVVMLVDFDDKIDDRKTLFGQAIPEDLKSRVFVIGSKENPESLRRELKMSFEKIGTALADDCLGQGFKLWCHAHLIQNSSELDRMAHVVKPMLFRN